MKVGTLHEKHLVAEVDEVIATVSFSKQLIFQLIQEFNAVFLLQIIFFPASLRTSKYLFSARKNFPLSFPRLQMPFQPIYIESSAPKKPIYSKHHIHNGLLFKGSKTSVEMTCLKSSTFSLWKMFLQKLRARNSV